MTREEALTMIIASIAMEELALSHILNAESEKLQYIIGNPNAGSQEVLAVNKSVTSLVETINQNQMLLKSKLDHVLEFYPLQTPELTPGQTLGQTPAPAPGETPGLTPVPPACRPTPCYVPCSLPCPPNPCSPFYPQPCQLAACFPHCPLSGVSLYEKSALQLVGQQEKMLWNPGCRLPWRSKIRLGKDVRLDERTLTQIQLNPGRSYAVQYTLSVSAASPTEETGLILLRQAPCGVFTDVLPLYFSLEHLAHGPQTLQFSALLYPRINRGYEAGLSLLLESKTPLYVERAAMDVVKLW